MFSANVFRIGPVSLSADMVTLFFKTIERQQKLPVRKDRVAETTQATTDEEPMVLNKSVAKTVVKV